jgi:hypothetical protein
VRHLVNRFFGFLRARPLAPSEQAWVSSVLDPNLRRLFFAQPFEDQRHAHDVARRVSPELAEAALLHDVGKSVPAIGAMSRSLATIFAMASIPVRGRWRQYLDHGEIGARLLEEAGASSLAVTFARRHPGPVPSGIDPSAWHALADADDA